jgi:S1-C subfamily serine protease
MRSVSICLLTLFVVSQSAMSLEAQTCPNIETQVLRIYCTRDAPYYHKPWKSPDFAGSRGTGFFFKDEKNFPGQDGLILTNAHAVSMAQTIKASNGKEKNQYNVRLVGVCDSADFAILKMEPAELATYERRNGKIVPLELGDSDRLRVGDKVLGWGYPLGGEGISKSEQGEISRIEVASYAHSGENWLMIQASLQQNRGNSGGPVLKDDKVVGIAFQGIRTTDRINYFIPINLVKHLIPLINDQDLIPRWRYKVQFMFPRLKEYFGLGPDQGGILMDNLIPEGGPSKFGLREKDILTSIDGQEIDNFGEIYFKPLEQRVFFTEPINRKKVGDDLSVSIIRDGKAMEIKGKLTQGLPRLVPRIFIKPNYFIFSGVGFVELTQNCIDAMDKDGEKFRAKYAGDFPRKPYQKIVIISELFPEYGIIETAAFLKRVKKINDQEILNIADLYNHIQSLIKEGKKQVLLEMDDKSQLPLDLEYAEKMDNEIQKKYGILNLKTPGGFKD